MGKGHRRYAPEQLAHHAGAVLLHLGRALGLGRPAPLCDGGDHKGSDAGSGCGRKHKRKRQSIHAGRLARGIARDASAAPKGEVGPTLPAHPSTAAGEVVARALSAPPLVHGPFGTDAHTSAGRIWRYGPLQKRSSQSLRQRQGADAVLQVHKHMSALCCPRPRPPSPPPPSVSALGTLSAWHPTSTGQSPATGNRLLVSLPTPTPRSQMWSTRTRARANTRASTPLI